MATLGDLWTSLFPWAVPLAPLEGAARDREVGWVRVLKARVPAFDALDAGDLAIVPAGALEAVAPGTSEATALVTEFVRARVAGLLLVEGDPATTGDGARGALEAVGASAVDGRAAGLPGGPARPGRARAERDRPHREPPGRARPPGRPARGPPRAARPRRAATSPASSGRSARRSSGRSPSRVVAGTPGGPCAGRRARAPRPPSPPTSPDRDGRPPGRPAAAATRRAGAAGGSRRGSERSSGSLALLGDRPASELERVVTERIAALLALELARDESVRRARDTTRRGEALPADGPPWVGPARRAGRPRGSPTRGAPRGCAPGDPAPGDRPADDPPRRRGEPRAAGRRGRRIGRPGRARPRRADRPIPRSTGRRLAPVRRPGRPARRRGGGARDARGGRGLVEPPPVARADRLAAYRLLGGLHNLPDGVRQARSPARAAARRTGRTSGRSASRRSGRSLDHPGPGEAAAALGVPPQHVAYRVRRIEAVTGWSLADPELRLALGHGPQNRANCTRLGAVRGSRLGPADGW